MLQRQTETNLSENASNTPTPLMLDLRWGICRSHQGTILELHLSLAPVLARGATNYPAICPVRHQCSPLILLEWLLFLEQFV
jgi:hypothetical protein